jgi:hypothetical protein
MRAYKARVGPLETMSIIPIRSFFMNPSWQRATLPPGASRCVTRFWRVSAPWRRRAKLTWPMSCHRLPARCSEFVPVYTSKHYRFRRLTRWHRLSGIGQHERAIDLRRVGKPMPLVFPKTANPAQSGGADPLDPRLEQRCQHHAKRERADGGVGRGPGGPPHNQCRLCGTGKDRLDSFGKSMRPRSRRSPRGLNGA